MFLCLNKLIIHPDTFLVHQAIIYALSSTHSERLHVLRMQILQFVPFFSKLYERKELLRGNVYKSYKAIRKPIDTQKHKPICLETFCVLFLSENFCLKTGPKIDFCCLWRKKVVFAEFSCDKMRYMMASQCLRSLFYDFFKDFRQFFIPWSRSGVRNSTFYERSKIGHFPPLTRDLASFDVGCKSKFSILRYYFRRFYNR